jgi:thioredoxin reductase
MYLEIGWARVTHDAELNYWQRYFAHHHKVSERGGPGSGPRGGAGGHTEWMNECVPDAEAAGFDEDQAIAICLHIFDAREKPGRDEAHDDFMERCVEMHEGGNTSEEQAIARCEALWSKKYDPRRVEKLEQWESDAPIPEQGEGETEYLDRCREEMEADVEAGDDEETSEEYIEQACEYAWENRQAAWKRRGVSNTPREKFDPNEPRDPHGRWTDGGAATDDHPGEGYSKDAYVDAKGVIHTNNVHDAARALAEDRKVELKQPKQVSTLLHELGKKAQEFAKQGKNAPVYNLCNVSVAGTNLFCAQSKGIPRIQMPQMDDDQTKAFRQYLKDKGYKVTKEREFAANLRATQSELNGAKVAAVMEHLRGKDQHQSKRLIISRDDYILDGHHHWAGKLGLDAEDGDLTNDTKLKIARVDIPIIKLLEEAEKFTGGKGHKPATEQTTSKELAYWRAYFAHWGVKQPGHDVSDEPRDPHGRFTFGAGGGEGGNYGLVPGDVVKYGALKAEWSKINNELLAYVDDPEGPESQSRIDRLEGIVKEMHGLHADPGGIAGVGLPGGPRDVTIIGAGPGGLAASINGAADGLDTLVVEANVVAGGQAKYSSRIENFPGFPIGVTGETLTQNMFEQAGRLGAETKLGVRVTGMTFDPKTGLKHITLSNGEKIESRAVIIAGGLEFRSMRFPGSEGPGVIVGDGKALAKAGAGGNVAVVGGSNGAAQAALGCTRSCDHVYLLARSPIVKSMSNYQIEALKANPKVTVIEGDSIATLHRDDAGNPWRIETAKGKTLPVKAVGEFLGSVPETKWVPADMTLAAKGGRIKTNADLATSVPGVYAVGDMRDGAIGRIGVAVGEGQMALRQAYNFLSVQAEPEPKPKPKANASDPISLISRLFDLDRANPWFGQTAEGVTPLKVKKTFDPSEPRDPHGRWTDGGGSDGGDAAATFERIGGGQALPVLYAHEDNRPAVSDYADEHGFGSMINMALRTDRTADLGERPKKLIADLTAEIKAAPRLPEDVTAYRVVGGEFAKQLKPGVEFEDKAFISTTINDDYAKRINVGPGKTMRMMLPKGTEATAVKGSNQYELILQRGHRFKVSGSNGYVDVEIVGGGR